MQTVSGQIISSTSQRKVNECIESLQLAVELSFNKIDAQLDELLNDESNSIIISKLQCDLTKVNSDCSLKLKQIYQEVNSLIKNNIQLQISNKEQLYQQQLQETRTQLQLIIYQKDSQIQQLINSQTIQQTQSNLKQFIYQLIPVYSIKQNEICRAIAVNKDCSILIATCIKQIKVFEFNSGMLKQTQILSEHHNNVYTLNFMNKSDHFISGSEDKSIILWTKNQNNSWICQQKLNGHTGCICYLISNTNEDLIVSGSSDHTIKFWQKQNQWLCSQTITDHNQCVNGLSFNEQQNKLISCGDDKLILVIEQSQLNKQWIVIQKITVEQYGKRLCFIDDSTFTFQPSNGVQLHVFEVDSTKQYTKTKDIQVERSSDRWLFPQQYIKSKCILVNKNASTVSLIRKKLNNQFINEQSIDFGTGDIFGCMTDDGQYLITWDDRSKEYQIRIYQEK